MIQKNWQELIKPKKLDIVLSEGSRRMATLVGRAFADLARPGAL